MTNSNHCNRFVAASSIVTLMDFSAHTSLLVEISLAPVMVQAYPGEMGIWILTTPALVMALWLIVASYQVEPILYCAFQIFFFQRPGNHSVLLS